MPHEDLSGRIIGRWHITKEYRYINGYRQYFCICKCGTQRYVDERNLLSHKSESCGCISRENNKARAEDLTDCSFGLLTARRRVEVGKSRVSWECDCECGNTIVVTAHQLKSGKTKSCGCLRKRQAEQNERIKDIRGMRRGSLEAKEPTGKRDYKGSAIWLCRCDCGNTVELSEDIFVHGSYVSCGCVRDEYRKSIYKQLHFVDDTCVEWLEKRKARRDNTSGRRGVYVADNGIFRASIGFQCKRYTLGTYATIEEAAATRERGEKELHEAFVQGYHEWEEKAQSDPEWAENNPYVFTPPPAYVSRKRTRHTKKQPDSGQPKDEKGTKQNG